MKKNSFIVVLVYGLLVSLTTLGQQPGCGNPVGVWKNQSNAVLTVLAFDAATGEIKGTYQPSSGAVQLPLTGWMNITGTVAGKDNVTPVAFSVSWGATGSVQSWTGFCREQGGNSTISTVWHLVKASSDSSWDHELTGADTFIPGTGTAVVTQPDTTQINSHPPDGLTLVTNSSCPVQGQDKNGNPPKATLVALNLLKNRETEPKGSNLDAGVTLTKMLNSNDNLNLFDQHKGATITGVLFDARQEKGESCNCNSTNAADWDFHIYISTGNAHSIFDCAVIEMTPYSRSIHPEWTLSFVKSLKGKKVTVTGWLLYDFEHTGQSFGTNPNTGAPNRHTVWEIHPVTSLKVAN